MRLKPISFYAMPHYQLNTRLGDFFFLFDKNGLKEGLQKMGLVNSSLIIL
jgi:hypothetical protein